MTTPPWCREKVVVYYYLWNKWLVTQAQCMIMVYMNVLQLDVCSNYCVSPCHVADLS